MHLHAGMCTFFEFYRMYIAFGLHLLLFGHSISVSAFTIAAVVVFLIIFPKILPVPSLLSVLNGTTHTHTHKLKHATAPGNVKRHRRHFDKKVVRDNKFEYLI
ncbi:hypothetical protein, unlikely [Trypanosoma brucei gambiense DAL972]|uniref:Uncharacterized protein n=1 Tax=Trypanosoma brucei gambiense (strain MHOM/CI/86/DAL972) TaxID=679716 RepID=C9ZU61_TRYB9|nr:hypothetical protein, unlikely [Trypanosoma brucei gambiense DAL972]CBH12947.1 hypothetical protein, unlikely [Trypanosoma brucei gambiense DAL972]|eukprot:XP_011775226.1 hypothetical protein, unlikely [Trypanosoma brucei gambiense DAL972]